MTLPSGRLQTQSPLHSLRTLVTYPLLFQQSYWNVAWGYRQWSWRGSYWLFELQAYGIVGLIQAYQILPGTGLIWLFATVFRKFSILWLYPCIFMTRPFKLAARTLMFIVSGYGIAFLCVFFTNCHPFSYSWNPVPGGYCKSVAVEELAYVSVNMIIDTSIVILPMPPRWGLRMSVSKKFAISGLFSLGLL